VIRFWGPWLDENHPNPAQSGELRWFTTIAGRDQDNPALLGTDYLATLQALPEPLRSKMLYGDFKAGAEDANNQIIPMEWVQAAQERWKARKRPFPAHDLPGCGCGPRREGQDGHQPTAWKLVRPRLVLPREGHPRRACSRTCCAPRIPLVSSSATAWKSGRSRSPTITNVGA